MEILGDDEPQEHVRKAYERLRETLGISKTSEFGLFDVLTIADVRIKRLEAEKERVNHAK